MELNNSDKSTSSAPMLPKDNGDNMVEINPSTGARETSIRTQNLADKPECGGCGRDRNCSGDKNRGLVLCWRNVSKRKYYRWLALLFIIFLLSMIGTILFCFTDTFNNANSPSMVIRNNSLAYKIWNQPIVQPDMNVYIFNYTNWDRVKAGLDAKLHVEELGPYTYSQQLERVNIEFDDDKLSFQDQNYYKFLYNKSRGDAFDRVVVPNLPLLFTISKTLTLNVPLLPRLVISSSLLYFSHPEAFLALPVHRFLWGYEDDIMQMQRSFFRTKGLSRYMDKVGLLAMKNRTESERFTINTGEYDQDKMGILEEVDGKDHLSYWGSTDCNSIEASDGSIFPRSQLDKNTTLHIFYPDLCRRLPFKFDKSVEVMDGTEAYRYRMPLNTFDDPSQNPENQCYCETGKATCPPRGIINVTGCTGPENLAPLVSFPHFYMADLQYAMDVTGLKPDPSKHESYIDLHPTLGIPLSRKIRFQINTEVMKADVFSALKYLRHGLILPVAWIEMSVDELPENFLSLVAQGSNLSAAAHLGLTVICIIALIGSGICLLWAVTRRKQRRCGHC